MIEQKYIGRWSVLSTGVFGAERFGSLPAAASWACSECVVHLQPKLSGSWCVTLDTGDGYGKDIACGTVEMLNEEDEDK